MHLFQCTWCNSVEKLVLPTGLTPPDLVTYIDLAWPMFRINMFIGLLGNGRIFMRIESGTDNLHKEAFIGMSSAR